VEYILSSLSNFDITRLVNQRDQYNEHDQWSVVYYTTWMGEQKWVAGKIDRNRLPHRMATVQVKTSEELRSRRLLSIRFEGRGDELDDESKSELEKLKMTSRPMEPDRSPLHYAVQVGNFELAKALLKKGADPNQPDWFGMTLLHAAAMCGDEAMAELLCNHEADPQRAAADRTLLDNTNSTPLQVAQDNGHQHLEQLLSPPHC